MLFTLEIDNRAVLVMAEDDLDAAEQAARSPEMAEELAELDRPGRRSGPAGTPQVRAATIHEAQLWRSSFERALAAGEAFEDEIDDWTALVEDLPGSSGSG